ncbi:hypothetical protein [Algoriphagus sp. A40]|uniref:hypothetical protein n=1 Tax=Algoriphagus sp. A40 TaxID=1945863 RepID=UPI00098587B5|nr:hypothetical protein [Algoriphagus sp. A40]OOG74898.1 hypothetical protein B0E43_10975 [Algoriphagus sp. A40]
MKKLLFSLAVILILSLFSCSKKEIKTELTSEDLAGYLDTHSGILFTTSADKSDVLTKLQAKPFEGELYTLPILEHEGKTVLYIFQLAEVERPWEFQDYKPTDICMDEVFQDFENQISSLINRNVPNLKDQIILACGKLAGDLEEGLNGQGPMEKDKEKLDEFKGKLLKNGQEKGEAAEKALKEGDPEAAKKEGEELNEEAKDEYYRDLDFCKEKLWDFSFRMRYKFEFNEEIPAELINEFERDFIRYKVYKSAACQDGPATLARICTQEFPLLIGRDTLNRPIQLPPRWISEEYFARKVCRIGNGFCVEQEVVIGSGKVYSDANCTRLINIREYKGFSCFDS